MTVLENVITAAITVAALLLTIVAIMAWRHRRSQRVAILTLAFAVLSAKGLFLSIALFVDSNWERPGLIASLLFDGAALGLFYAAVLRPGAGKKAPGPIAAR